MNAKPTRTWNRLDNAAKIFPPTTTRRDPKVFRFSCRLTEEVEPELLQQALDATIRDFPVFRCILKSGAFWYYLEESSLAPHVQQETAPPCSTMYKSSKKLLFQVLYFRQRISLEVYHALTDGTGAMQFFKELVSRYLSLRHPDTVTGDFAFTDYDASFTQRMNDSFDHYYDRKNKQRNPGDPPAFQLRGLKNPEGVMTILEGQAPTRELLLAAKGYGATATVLLTSILLRNIGMEMRVADRKKPVILSIPVNLRNYFDSQSARNFFSLIPAGMAFPHGVPPLSEVVAVVREQFAQRLTREYLQNRLDDLEDLEHNPRSRIVPLPLKNLAMKTAFQLSERASSAALSNMGVVTLPEQLLPYVEYLDVMTSTPKLQLCVCSCGGVTSLCFSSAFLAPDVPRRFFRTLADLGVPLTIVTNRSEEEPT